MELSELQKFISGFTQENKISAPLSFRCLDLVSEVGELAKELLDSSSYGSEEFTPTSNWGIEIGDILFSLICIANQTGINLENVLQRSVSKYKRRIGQKGNLASS